MKHVSRVLFGFSIVAVLALFTACPQAADTKKDTPDSATPTLGTVSFEVPAEDNKVTIKVAGIANGTAGTDYNKLVVTAVKQGTSDAVTLAPAEITLGDDNAVETLKNTGTAFTLSGSHATPGADYTFTLQLKKDADNVGAAVEANSKSGKAAALVPTLGAVSFEVPAEDNKVTIKVAGIANGTAGTDYNKLVVTAVKQGTSDAVTLAPAEITLSDDNAVETLKNTGTAFTLSGSHATPGADYTFTLQLKKDADNVGAAVEANSKSGKNS